MQPSGSYDTNLLFDNNLKKKVLKKSTFFVIEFNQSVSISIIKLSSSESLARLPFFEIILNIP